MNVSRKPNPQPLTFRPTARRGSLIEWNDASRQAHVLDWHQRAHEFGLEVHEQEDVDGAQPYGLGPKRRLEEQEPEAFTAQHVDDDAEFDAEVEEEEERPLQPGIGREDVDLV